jgi:hypothetical protein
MKEENKLKTTTYIKLDFIDCIKLLFGRCIIVEVNSLLLIKDNSISGSNSFDKVSIEKTSSNFTKVNKLPFGWEIKPEKRIVKQ